MTAYRARNGAVRLRRLVTGSAEWIVGLITKATDEIQRIENLFYEYEQARASHPDGQ